MRRLTALALLTLVACTDETISGYADPYAVYRLTEIDGAPFAGNATITFPEEGTVRGEAPCNSWFASQSAPYPWIEFGPIGATRRACPDLDAERAYFDALGTMTLAEVQGTVLILSNDAGREMVFRATP
jgi:heat shock protein HslJ